ncbi:MAG: arsenical pump-driving ATPase, partial [Phycisphaeraceae bacterium]
MQFLTESPRYVFFTGKGGVGKTSLACATAVRWADEGQRVLLVSTDPASNLGHVFGVNVSSEPLAIPQVPGLDVLNVNPNAAAAAYRERVVGPVRGILPEEVVTGMTEQLSGACTIEIAAFDEFTRILTSAEHAATYDHIIFDTAPTGHTLRLLTLPSAWSGFIETNEHGASCLGPLSGLKAQQHQYQQAVEALSDPAKTVVILVTRPESGSLTEAARSSSELATLGLASQRLIVNGLLPAGSSDDPLAIAMRSRQERALEDMPAALKSLPRDTEPLRAFNVVGIAALRSFLRDDPLAVVHANASTSMSSADLPGLSALIDEAAASGHGLIMVMGKGGVGKTTVAAAIAVELADRGHEVLLTTTDPAAHVAQAVHGDLPHLKVSRIDPRAETEAYRAHVMELKGKNLDAAGRALLEEDLRSPCTEEVAVFSAFSRVIQESGKKFVVMDTAPTGHTLLLLDATGAYHRDVLRNLSDKAGKVTTPMMRLQDTQRTRVVIVTLAETTPVLEASELQEDLRRAGIEPFAWVVNSSLAAAGPRDPLLRL